MLVNGEEIPNNVTVLQSNSLKRINSVTMLNNVSATDKFKQQQAKTEYIADKLVQIFSAPEWRRFFLKVAWRLSEDAIWTATEMANRAKVKKKLNYFIAACNKQMVS